MYICDRCQKGLQVGMNVSHSHRRTKKRSLPNLHVLTVRDGGKNKTMRLCTKCARIVQKQFPYLARENSAANPPVGGETPKQIRQPAEKSPEKEVAAIV